MVKNNVLDRLEVAKEAALKASNELLKFFRCKNLKVSSKKEGGFVSQADMASSNLISNIISAAFPDDGYVCEEREEKKQGDSGFAWIIDPLDGTTNFIRGNSDFSISICLTKKEIPVMGMVYAPYKRELYWSLDKKGAWVEYGFESAKKRLWVSKSDTLTNSILEFPGGIENTRRSKKVLELIRIFYPGVRPRVSESAALTLCKVASGEVDAYLHPTEKPHDFAAGAIIVKEAGGLVTSFLDDQLSVHKRGIIAANEKIHHSIIHKLKDGPLEKIEYWMEE